MKFKIRFADQIVGFFSIAAIAGLFVLVFALGSKQNWFSHKIPYYSFFDSASGLTVGMDLTYKGFSIGKIKKITLESHMVKVEYYVLEDYATIVRWNSLVELITSPIGLGTSFAFYPGRSEEILPEGSEIFRVDTVLGQKILEKGLNRLDRPSDSIGVLMKQASELLTRINSLVATVDKTLNDKTDTSVTRTLRNVAGISENLEQLTKSAGNGDGLLPSVLGDDVAVKLTRLIESLNTISTELEGVAGNSNDLLSEANGLVATASPQVDSVLVQLNTVLLQVEDVVSGIKNNPLIRMGISDRSNEASSTTQLRSTDF